MTLTSINFFVFVAAVLLLYYCFPKKLRWTVLLAASYFYYIITCPKYFAFILFTTISTYFGALKIDEIAKNTSDTIKARKNEWSLQERKNFKLKEQKKKKKLLAIILVINFGILATLKYYNNFSQSLAALINKTGLGISFPSLGILLPLGISFYTFQTMGYAVDVYRGKTKSEKNIGKLALFTSFFPQIIQGPISIYNDLAPQLYEPHSLKFENIRDGFQLIIWGLFKKIVIADRFIQPMNKIAELRTAGQADAAKMFLYVLLYSVQLYADFSGGIDISRGIAKMLGIDLAINFKRPYFSKSISEYWRRWHITLGAWCKNYIFYPVAMSKPFVNLGRRTKEKFGRHLGKQLPGSIATIITFLVIGIWHGSNLKYVGFGLWNGLVIFCSNLLEPSFQKINKKLKIRTETFSFRIFQMARTFIIVLVGYYFDIADNFRDAVRLIIKLFTDLNLSSVFSKSQIISIGFTKDELPCYAIGITVLFAVSLYEERNHTTLQKSLNQQSIWFQWFVMLVGIAAIFVLGSYGPGFSASDFVYMQF